MKKRKFTEEFSAQLHKTIFQARYNPNLRFFELLYPVAQKFEKRYPHWSTDRLSISLFNYESQCSLAISNSSFSYHQDSNKFEESNLKEALDLLPSSLQIESYTRMGYRRKYLIPVDISFQELVNIMNLKFLSQDRKLTEIMPPNIADLQYVMDSSDDRFRYHFRIGPVSKLEIPRHVDFLKEHLDPSNRESGYQKIVQSYPKVAVFLDIDIFKEETEIPVKDGFPFIKESQQKMESAVGDIKNYLF